MFAVKGNCVYVQRVDGWGEGVERILAKMKMSDVSRYTLTVAFMLLLLCLFMPIHIPVKSITFHQLEFTPTISHIECNHFNQMVSEWWIDRSQWCIENNVFQSMWCPLHLDVLFHSKHDVPGACRVFQLMPLADCVSSRTIDARLCSCDKVKSGSWSIHAEWQLWFKRVSLLSPHWKNISTEIFTPDWLFMVSNSGFGIARHCRWEHCDEKKRDPS